SPTRRDRSPCPRSAARARAPPRRRARPRRPRAGGRSREPREERERAGLVEHVVQIAALRALDARRAAVDARAAADHARRVGDPALELLEAALGDPHAARVAVVDEYRGPARL